MKPAFSPGAIKKILRANDLKTTKSLGQNFLIDNKALHLIVKESGINKSFGVLEIGPGIGALTFALSEYSGKVVSVELDRSFTAYLTKAFSGCHNVEIVQGDALKSDLNRIIADHFNDMPVAIVANLPYYITTPLIMKFFEDKLPVTSVTVMIQKEVADRITASPSTPEYGALSVACQYYSKPEIITFVPPDAFYPPPKVTSAVIRLDIEKHIKPKVTDEKKFFKVVRSAFCQRRKTLANALSATFDMPKDDIKHLIIKVCGDVNIRGENLDITKFIEISEMIY